MRNLVSENLSSLTWSPDGNFLAYICSGIIEPWDLRTDELEILYREQAPPCNIAFSSNSQQLAYLTAGYDLGLVDITMRTTIGKQKLHLDTVGEAVWLRFSDDDQILYTPKGRIDIASFSSDGAKPTTNRSSIVEDGWVIHGSQKVFRFPVGDKVRFSPVIEDTLIVGYESGRVDLLEFNGGSWGLEIGHVILSVHKIYETWQAQLTFNFSHMCYIPTYSLGFRFKVTYPVRSMVIFFLRWLFISC